MTDLFAHVASEPQSALAIAIFLFAAGMFPIGLMLGAPCSKCCGLCSACTSGKLPDTITVTLDGLSNSNDDGGTTCCGDFYNGKSFVLKRNHPLPAGNPACTFRHEFCGVGNVQLQKGFLEVIYLGPNSPPVVRLGSEGLAFESVGTSTICNTIFTTATLILDCGDFSFTAEAPSGATAVVSPDGSYEHTNGYHGDESCHICCQGSEPIAEEVEATVKWRYEETGVGTYEIEADVTLLLDPVSSWPNSQNAKSPTWRMLGDTYPSAYWMAVAHKFNDAENEYSQATGFLHTLLGAGGAFELGFCGIGPIGTEFGNFLTFDPDMVGVDGLQAAPLPGFVASINTCDTQEANGWSGSEPAAYAGCAECHKTCWTSVAIDTGSLIGCEEDCETCNETPMCRPTPGVYGCNCTQPFPYTLLPGTSSFSIEIL